MKANEAPEKIYVKITHPISEEYTEIIAFEHGKGIEYIHKDVFIEKVCEFLKYFTDDNGMVEEKLSHITETLKSYLKGE